MPCGMCVRQSRANFFTADVRWFRFENDRSLVSDLHNLDLNELLSYKRSLPDGSGLLPLGELVLPSLRWRQRLYLLNDDADSRKLCRGFMYSAWSIALQYLRYLDQDHPQAIVLFNGTHFPEAVVSWLSRQRGIRVITHESGFQPMSGYFVEGEVTSYPIIIPDVELTPAQDSFLESELQKRWQGDFSMAGVRFWQQIQDLPVELMNRTKDFDHIVAIFTNVIFDTTQMYANVIFVNMFDWLDELLKVFQVHPRTLFVLRAHPDEERPGKSSRQSVTTWYENHAARVENLDLIPPREQINSYTLVQKSKFVLTYNSTIGLESILLGVPVLAAGQAPFNAYDTVFTSSSREEYLQCLEDWLKSENLELTNLRQRNTRRFLYYRTYRYSLPFSEFLEITNPVGYVRLKHFPLTLIKNSCTSKALLTGLYEGKGFELDV